MDIIPPLTSKFIAVLVAMGAAALIALGCFVGWLLSNLATG